MRLNILIAGRAGQGINQAAKILSKALVKEGLYAFNYREYGSLVTGGKNFNVICFSDEPIYSHDMNYDFAIILDEKSLKKHEENFDKRCVVLKNFEKGKGVFLDSSKFKKVENVYFLGALFKILNLNKKSLEKVISEVFKGKSLLKKDLEAVDEAYKIKYNSNKSVKSNGKIKGHFMEGAEAVGVGSIEAGLDTYFAYPMTPSTSLLGFLSKNAKNHDYLTYQPENEIAVANAALGSSFSGAKTMIGSSGGGFDLMTEAISMQGMTNLPLVVYLAARDGPSSGAATHTSQQDLKLALNCGHGDFFRVVIAPGDIKECYEKSKEAFYIAEKYGLLNILLTDKHLVESGFTQKIDKYKLFAKKNRKILGKEYWKINSYSHDEKGNYTEDPKIIKEMADKRKKNFEDAKKEIEKKFEMFKVYGKKTSKKLLIGFGSSKGAILDSLKNLKDYKYLSVSYLEPFSDKLKKEIEKSKEIFVIEGNVTGQLADLIEKHTSKKIDDKHRILKYDGRPFTPADIIGVIK